MKYHIRQMHYTSMIMKCTSLLDLRVQNVWPTHHVFIAIGKASVRSHVSRGLPRHCGCYIVVLQKFDATGKSSGSSLRHQTMRVLFTISHTGKHPYLKEFLRRRYWNFASTVPAPLDTLWGVNTRTGQVWLEFQ